MSVATLRPVKDVYVTDDDADAVFDNTNLIAQDVNLGTSRRVLIEFDLTDVPASATVTAAALTMEVTAITGTPSATITRVIREISEQETTWNTATTGVPWTAGGAGGDGTDIDTTDEVTGWLLTVGSDTSPSILALVSDAIASRAGVLRLRIVVVASSGQIATMDSRRMLIPAGQVPPTLAVTYTVPVGTAEYDGALSHVRAAAVTVDSLDGGTAELDLFFYMGVTPSTPFVVNDEKLPRFRCLAGVAEGFGAWQGGPLFERREFDVYDYDAPVVVSGEIVRWRVRLKEKIPASIWAALEIDTPQGAFVDDNTASSPAAIAAGYQNLCNEDFTDYIFADIITTDADGSEVRPDGLTLHTSWDFARVSLNLDVEGHSQTGTPTITADPGGPNERAITATFIAAFKSFDVMQFAWTMSEEVFADENLEVTLDGADVTISTSVGDVNPDSFRKAGRVQFWNKSAVARPIDARDRYALRGRPR